MTRGPIWGNRNRTKKSQNLKCSSELTYRMYKLCKLLLVCTFQIKVITKLPNSEQSYKGKVQTHNYINRQNQSTTGKL